VAVLSGHTGQQAATTALGRARRRASAGAGEWAALQVRAADQISSRLVWDNQTKRGVVHLGPSPGPSGCPRFGETGRAGRDRPSAGTARLRRASGARRQGSTFGYGTACPP